MEFYQILLVVCTLTTGLVAGFFFTFTTVLMPGLRSLGNKDYIRSFQAIDRILQSDAPPVKTRPFFGLVFFGAIISLVATLVFGFGHFTDTEKIMIIFATIVYALGALAPTLAVNLPLNKKIQAHNVDRMSESELKIARQNFEPRWNEWNLARTIASITTFALLIILAF